MRSLHVFLLLAVVLVAIAIVARSGILTRQNPGEPASKYMRAALDASQTPQLSTEEAAMLADKFPTATVSPSGLRYIIRAPGTGEATPRRGQQVTVQYEGRLLRDGSKFDSSYDRHQPLVFQVGVGRVIPGWDATLVEMKRGERRTVIIPWWLAYGEKGRPPVIPPKTSLVFDIELLDFH
jgi:FKBP-type peptidyl-prolyl cis-trans isomerase